MKVLMIGPGKGLKGGISSVVESYYNVGIDKMVDLRYLETFIEGSRYEKFIFAIKALNKFKSMSNDIDIIHVHMSSRGSFYRKSLFILKAYKLNKKIILHIHGSEFEKFYKKECNELAKKYVRYIFSLCDKVIALSDEWRDILGQITDICKIDILYNSIEINKIQKYKDYKKKKILFLGRIGKRKGVYDILSIVPNIIKKHPDAEFILAGDGEVEKIKEICKENKLENNCIILGWTSGEQKIKLLTEATIYLLPSYNEGMPISILEAMANKLPIISTNIGGIPQLIENNKEGFLIEPGNLMQLEESINLLLDSENLRMKLGQNSFTKVDNNFNLDKNIKKLYSIYSRV